MKKIIFILLMLFCVTTINYAQDYERQGTTFVSKSTRGGKTEPIKTRFTWKDTKGNTYPIYMSGTGSCFVLKISKKTGKEYKSYLGPEVSQEICKELGVEYKGKKN